MKKLRERQVSLRMALTMCAAAGAITAVICLISTGWNTNEVGKKLREIDRLVSDKYVGELDADNVADYAAAGYITGLGDKWSSYIPAENYEAYRMSGEGKGCGIGVSVTSTETSIRVTLVYDDSPAAKAGIQKGDYILGTGDLTTEKDGSSAVISAISGKEGTDVTVTVKKADGSAKELTMQRAVVTQKMAWGKMLNDKIGYIRIENFHDGCADQFKTALQFGGQLRIRRNRAGLIHQLVGADRRRIPVALGKFLPQLDELLLEFRLFPEFVLPADAIVGRRLAARNLVHVDDHVLAVFPGPRDNLVHRGGPLLVPASVRVGDVGVADGQPQHIGPPLGLALHLLLGVAGAAVVPPPPVDAAQPDLAVAGHHFSVFDPQRGEFGGG